MISIGLYIEIDRTFSDGMIFRKLHSFNHIKNVLTITFNPRDICISSMIIIIFSRSLIRRSHSIVIILTNIDNG